MCNYYYKTVTTGKGKRAKTTTVAYIRGNVSKKQQKKLRGSKYGV